MDAVKSFNTELSSLYEVKPPISKAKMTALTRGAIKGIKFYKHVVQSVEKFILKCKPEYKVPGLYVIDSIVRQSRHQFGADKDVFAPRFAKNMQQTFMNLFKCPAEDKSKIIRVLNLWQKNQVFAPEVVQPLFDLADPNHPIHKEIQSAAAHQAQLAAAAAAQAQQAHSNGAQQVVAQVAQALLAGKGSPAIQKTPTKTQQMQQNAVQDQTPNNTLNQSTNMDANTLAQLQQLHRLLLRQQGGDKAVQEANVGNMAGSGVYFDKKLLDFDYGSDEDDDGGGHGNGPSPKMSAGAQQGGGGMDVGNLLANPEVLRQLTTLQQTLTQPSMHEDMEKMRKLQQMKQQEDEFDKHLAQTVPNLPFAAECEFKPNQMSSDLSHMNMNSFYMPANDLMQMNLPPPGFIAQQQQLLQMQQQIEDGMNDPEVEFVGTGDNIIEVIDQDSPTPVQGASPSNNRHSPTNDKHSGRRRNRSRSRDRSSPGNNRRSSRRGRSRSRSRSRDRSPRRRHRSRSKDKERGGEKDKGAGKTVLTEMDRERDRERSKRGLPPIKKENLSVCSTTLWVGHLSKLVHQEDISDTFGEFGEIVTIDMILPRGCAFVVMNRRQDASRCLTKLKGFKIQQKAITLAWAPGKGVKGKDLKDYWEGDLGVSYIPWSKLKPDIDIDMIEDGGMIDEETAPAWLKPKLDRSASHMAAMNLMKPEGDMTTMPPYLGQPPNVVTSIGNVVDTSQPPPAPPAGPMMPGQPMPSLPQLVSPFQLNNQLIAMNLPPGLMPNVNIGVPPPNLQNALMTNQLLSLNAAVTINAAVAAAAAAQQQQQQQPPPSLTATLLSQLGNLGDVGKPPPPNSVVDPTIPPPSTLLTTMAQQQQPSLSETLLSLAQQQPPPPQPFNLMHHPPPIQDPMDIEMEDVLHDGGARGNSVGQSLSDQLLSMQNAPGNQMTRPPPSFQAPPPSDNSNTFTSALSRLHAVTNHRNDDNQPQEEQSPFNQPNNSNRRDDNSPSRNSRDNRDSNRDRRSNNRDNNRDSRNKGSFDSRDSNNRGRDRDRDNNGRDSNRRGRDNNRDRDSRDNRDRDRNSSRGGGGGSGGYGNNRDGRDDRRDRRSNDRGGDRDGGKGEDWSKGGGGGDGVRSRRGQSGEKNNRWGPNQTSQSEPAIVSSGPTSSSAPDDKEKERRQREKALNDRLREMAGMEKQDDKPSDGGRPPPRDRDDRPVPQPLMGIDRPPPLFPDGPPGPPPKPDEVLPSSDSNKNPSDERRNSTNSNNSGDLAGGAQIDTRPGTGGGRPPPFRRSSSNDDDGPHGPVNKRPRPQAGRLLDIQSGPPSDRDLPPPLLEVDGPPPDFPPPIMNLPPEFVEHPDMMGGAGPPVQGQGIFEPPPGRNVSEFDGPPLMMRGEGREERFPPPRERFRDERGPSHRGGPTPLLDFLDDGPPGFRGGDNFHRSGPPHLHQHHHGGDFGGSGPIDMFQDDDMGGPPPGGFEPPIGVNFGGGPPPGGFNPDFGPPPGFGNELFGAPGEFGPPDEFGPPSEFGPPEEFDGGFRGRGRFRGGRGGPPRGGGPRGHWMDNDGPPHRNNFGRPQNFPGPDGPGGRPPNNFTGPDGPGGRPPNNFTGPDGPGGRPPNNFRDGPPGGGGRFGQPPPNDFEFDGPPPGDDMQHMMMYENEQMHGGGGMHHDGGWRDNRRGGRGRGGVRGGLRGGRGGGFNNNNNNNNNPDQRNKSWRNPDTHRDSENKFNKFNKHGEDGSSSDNIAPPRRSGTPLRDEPVAHAHSEHPAPPGVTDAHQSNVGDNKNKTTTTNDVKTPEKADSKEESQPS